MEKKQIMKIRSYVYGLQFYILYTMDSLIFDETRGTSMMSVTHHA